MGGSYFIFHQLPPITYKANIHNIAIFFQLHALVPTGVVNLIGYLLQLYFER